MTKKSEPFYQKWMEHEFADSPTVLEMSDECALIYRAMCQKAFAFGKGGLPADPVLLRRILRVPARYFRRHAGGACEQFEERDGRLFHRRVDKDLHRYAELRAGSETGTPHARAPERASPSSSSSSYPEGKDTLLLLSSAQEPGIGKEGIFPRRVWKKKQDGIEEATSMFAEWETLQKRRLLLENALDCWARRKEFQRNPATVFRWRCKRGVDTLRKVGGQYETEVSKILRGAP